MARHSSLTGLTNIGPTIARRLADIGIHTRAELASVGSVEAFRRLQARAGEGTVPVCYYLYSLEGALRGIHWDHLPIRDKLRLVEEVDRVDASRQPAV